VKIDMKRLGFVKNDAHNRDKWRSLTTENCPTLPQCGRCGPLQIAFSYLFMLAFYFSCPAIWNDLMKTLSAENNMSSKALNF